MAIVIILDFEGAVVAKYGLHRAITTSALHFNFIVKRLD